MKITMYELLGMLKDGKAPKYIKHCGAIYSSLYFENTNSIDYEDVKSGDLLFADRIIINEQLNDEVEIIEEENKIPEKLDMVLLGQCDNWLQPTIETDEKIRAELNPYVIDIIRENTLEIQHKFNELLDYLKSKGE